MFVSGSSDLQNKARKNLVSPSDQPAGQIVLPPFSGELRVDDKLNLSRENFKQSIEDFFRHKDTTSLSQLTATPLFPTPHLLAQLANKTYTDYKTGETDAQYEARLALPDGWKLLTTASNGSKTNGYFGAAYWHPEHQQVVIAHRGTGLTNLGALWTDLFGVALNQHVRQMESASTFAYKVVEELQRISRMKGVSFQLFCTGHSLGAWLAQVTTFTTEYLKIEGNLFLKGSNDNGCYHPHTVVFDSPGCKDMLLKMKDTFDVRNYGRSIDLEHLDITSYLSAPNRINTCDEHVGTVYRIFIDLSGMGWWEKNTELYTLATHSMQKIVEAFDPKTGRVCKDEQGQLKVEVVVDWPISSGFKDGEEYKKFFEWAKHFNNYHPDIIKEYFQYSPIRYQTKLYNEQVNSFSTFSQEEQEFLQCYRWLRQWREFFKPKELFAVMKNNQAQEDAEQILESFDIENNTVRFTDASALQKLISYVKRLLQLFPEIKEETKLALSSNKVRNRVYQFETERYVKRINQSPLEFNCDCLGFREFLESEQQKVLHLEMVKGDEWTGLIKLHQDLQKSGCLNEGQYIVLKLKCLLKLNQLMDLSKLMQSTVTPYLLLIACEDNQQWDEETRDVIRTLFDTIKRKRNIKIIFITQLGGSIADFLHQLGRRLSGNGFVRGFEELTWSDLTKSSQEKLLEKSVKFQGAKVSLNELMSAECPAAKFLSLGDLLEEKELQIADSVPVSNAYDESYYIGRIFCYQTTIKQEIFNDTKVRSSRVYLARSEQEYKQSCQLNPESNVHWLEKDDAGELHWRQSQGSLETVRTYIDTNSSHTYTDGDLVELLEQAQQQRVMLISDTAGMGKSTVLTHVSKIIKRTSPAKWVVRIDLNDHTDVLKALKEGQIDSKKVTEFVSARLLKLKPGLETELFSKLCCEQKHKVRIVMMLDGFDEISPYYKETVIGLLQALRLTAVEQLWVTTRPHLRKELEDTLLQLSYTLQPFSEENKIEFLTKFWSLKDWFTEMNSREKQERKKKLRTYAEALLKKLAGSVGDKDKKLTGIPLQCRMLAEAFDKEVRTFCQSSESSPELQFQLDLFGLYGLFIDRKYDIFQEEKLQVRVSKAPAIAQREHNLKSIRQDYQLLALNVLFTEEQVELFQNNSECIFPVEELTRYGIVQINCDGKLHFIHRTFAEYYVADCLVNHLTKGCKTSLEVQTFILKDIFQKHDYRVIRVFVDGLLPRYKLLEKILKQYGSRIDELQDDCLLHRAALEGDANIVEFLLQSARAGGYKDTANRLLMGQDRRKRTAWFIAAQWGKLQVLQKIWDWAKDNLTKEEKKNKFLLATDSDGDIAWHRAVEIGALDVLQKIWDLAKESLTREEIKNKLLFSTDSRGNTALQLAARRGKLDLLQNIWDMAKGSLTTEEIKNNLLLNTDSNGNTAWHLAAKWGGLHVLQKIWDLAKDNLTTEEIKNKMLLAKDIKGNTVWRWAAEMCKLDILQKIWDLAKDSLTTEEIKNKMLLATDSEGNTAWYMAAFWGLPDVLQKIWDWAKESLTTEEIKNKLLLATDSKGNTAWHWAAERGKLDILQKIWDLAKYSLTTEDIKNKLLLATDNKGNTAWHLAAEGDKLDVLQKIWDLAKDSLTTEEVKNILLLVTDSDGNTVRHREAERGKLDVLQKIWDLARQSNNRGDIK